MNFKFVTPEKSSLKMNGIHFNNCLNLCFLGNYSLLRFSLLKSQFSWEKLNEKLYEEGSFLKKSSACSSIMFDNSLILLLLQKPWIGFKKKEEE